MELSEVSMGLTLAFKRIGTNKRFERGGISSYPSLSKCDCAEKRKCACRRRNDRTSKNGRICRNTVTCSTGRDPIAWDWIKMLVSLHLKVYQFTATTTTTTTLPSGGGGGPTETPEFPTTAIPAITALGGYLAMRTRRREWGPLSFFFFIG